MTKKQPGRPRTRRWDIEVTAEDIAKAVENDSVRCVVVRAVARTIPEATSVDVDLQAIRFTLNGQRLLFLTPYVVQGYIVAFDAGEDIEPFRFRIQSPQVLRRRVRTEAGKAIDKARKQARAEATDKARKPIASRKAEPAEPAKPAEPDLASVKDLYRAEAQTVTEPGDRRPPRRAIKSRTRVYGQRLLRVNQ